MLHAVCASSSSFQSPSTSSTVSVPHYRASSSFSYKRASPSVRWPDLQLKEEEKERDPNADWISLAENLNKKSHSDTEELELEAPDRKITGYTPPVNPYIAARGKPHPALAAQNSLVDSILEPNSRPYSPNGKLIRLSKLALRKAKDWRERVQRLATAICDLGTDDSVADLLKEWHEQLSPTDMCYVVRRVGDHDWRRALELYEWYNRKHWYDPHARMLAGVLSILGRVHQVSLARELFNRAQPSFGKCVQVYNAIMGVYARQGDYEHVQELLALMKEQGCDPDLITYNTIINARCKAGLKPGMAVQLLKDMKREHLTPDVITYNTLISSCASRNDSAEAEKLFEDMNARGCEPDLWTYNALISLYARTPGKEKNVIECFEAIQEKRLVPDAVTYNSVLYAFAKSGRVNDVEKVRSQMIEAGCSSDEITYNTMISMYGKLGLHKNALSLYDEMKKEGCRPDTVTYTILINVLGKAGLVSQAEKIFQEMSDSDITPTLQGFSAMVFAYTKVGKLEEAQVTYECMLQSGIVPDNLAFNLILDVLMKADLPQKAVTMYHKALKHGLRVDLINYGTLLWWFSRKRLLKEVDVISNNLMQSGFRCDEICDTFIRADLPEKAAHFLEYHSKESNFSETIVFEILKSFGCISKFHEAQSFIHSLSNLSPEMEITMKEAVIELLAEHKQVYAVKDELRKFRKLSKPLGFNTFKMIIAMFYDLGMFEEVMEVASEMQYFGIELDDECKERVTIARRHSLSRSCDKEVTNITLDSYVSQIEEYGKQHLWEKAETKFKEIQKAGYRPSLKAWNALISSYAICGEYANAKLAFAAMISDGNSPTSATCNAMLKAAIIAERPNDISSVIMEMRQYGVNPGKNVFLAIVDSAIGNGKVQLAKTAFEELKRAGYLPNLQIYKTMILLFTRVKLVREAENMIHEMETDGFSPDVTIYNTMITLYGKLGFYRKGAELFMSMQAAGCIPDSYTFNSLIWLYSKSLKIQEALNIVREMDKSGIKPDVESYTALISACGRLSMLDAAEIIFKEAYESGCKLNYKLFHAMMTIYRNSGQPDMVKSVLTTMKSSGIAPTLGTFHLLMDSYGKGGDPEQAESVLHVMQEAGFNPGTLQHTGVIIAYLKNDEYDIAITKLLKLKEEGFEPDYMLWTAMVSSASHCRKSSESIKLLTALADTGFSLPFRLLTGKSLSLVSEFDALLQGLESIGLEAGLGFTNALLDLLWAFEMRATAGRLFAVAIERNIYPSTMARVQVKDWHADFRRLSAGAALVALTLWLDQMQDAALQGFPEQPKLVTLVTGSNLSPRNKISVEQTVKVHLWTMGSPFLKSKVRSGLFEAKGYSLCHWLKDSSHCMDLKLRNFSVLPETNSMQVHGRAFMSARLVSALQQIEESMGDLRPKKFRRLIHMTELKRTEAILAEIKSKDEMKRKGRVNLKRQRKGKFRKRLHKIQK